MELYMVRHGITMENKRKLYYGTLDSGILPESRQRYLSFRSWFQKQGFDAVFSSPLMRAAETARILLPDRSPVLDARLEERHFGIFEGKTYGEILQEYPQEARLWEKDWMNYVIPGGESFMQVQRRAAGFADDILQSGYDKVLIVSHKGTMIQLLLALLDIPERLYWKFTLEPECYTCISHTYGNTVLTALNQRL